MIKGVLRSVLKLMPARQPGKLKNKLVTLEKVSNCLNRLVARPHINHSQK